MKEFRDKVAVVTGSASGIGRGIAERCVQEGMKVILADIEEDILSQTERELKATGVSALAVPTDVSKASDVEALAQKTLDTFGAVHLLCNNAGVGRDTTIWESTIADWEWVMGVNLWGVIHGIRTFVPIMLEQSVGSHIINTSSMAGLISGPGIGTYKVTKHAVITLSETLYHELAQRGVDIHVSVLCPSYVNTRIMDSDRNRPAEFQNDPVEEMRAKMSPEYRSLDKFLRKRLEGGMSPQQAAECVFNAIREEKFYIILDDLYDRAVKMRMEDVVQQRNPTDPFSGM